MGQLGRMAAWTINTPLMHIADKYAETADYKKMTRLQLVGSATALPTAKAASGRCKNTATTVLTPMDSVAADQAGANLCPDIRFIAPSVRKIIVSVRSRIAKSNRFQYICPSAL